MPKFREDRDLFVLALSSHQDLERLSRVMTHDESDGEERYAQELLADPSYKEAAEGGDLRPAWRAIAAELQAYGGDSIVNKVRGLAKGHTGVAYREIVTDLCEHLKIKLRPADDIKSLEDQFLVGLINTLKDKFQAKDIVRTMEEAAKSEGFDANLHEGLEYDELIKYIITDAKISYLFILVVPAIASVSFSFLGRLAVPAVSQFVATRFTVAVVPGVNVAAAAATVVTLVTSPAVRVTFPAALEVMRIRRAVLLSPMSEGNEA